MKHLSFIFFLFFSLYWGQNTKSQNSSSKSTTIPFVISDGVIFLKGEINGIGANIVWDNGFSYCGIDKSFSKKLGLEPNKVKKAMDGTGEIIGIGFTTIPSFKFGTIEKSKVKGIIFDSSVIPTDSKIDAIIGAELINQYIWDFNFDNNLLTVSKKPSQKEFVQEFPFVIGKDHIHFIPIELGNKKVYIHSDFGSNSQFLEVSPHFAQLIFDKNIPKLTLEGGIYISVSGKNNNNDVSYLLKNSYGFATPTAELSPDFTPFVHITDHINEDAVLGNNFFINLGNLVID
ncbi:retropepsin-like aspartic protease, partial [Chryseobacterium sp.]|uniref:retropepsin-like aspartic protease n=1 Tax=Chryseobacterium sp. TaxID=1871047 RepID=UPI0025BE2BDE